MEAPLSAGRERPDDRCFPKMLALWTVRGNRPLRIARSRHDIQWVTGPEMTHSEGRWYRTS